MVNSEYVRPLQATTNAYIKPTGEFTREEFYQLLHKRKIQKNVKPVCYTMNSTMNDIKDTWIGKRLKQIAILKINKDAIDLPEKRMMEASFAHMQLRQLTMTGFSYSQVQWILSLLNRYSGK